MKYKTAILTTLLCLGLIRATAAVSWVQSEPDKPKTGDTPKPSDKTDKSPPADSVMTVRFKISAEKSPTLPTQSKIEMSGADEKCKDVQGSQYIKSGEVTFTKLPVCKIKLTIFITGFNSQIVSIDLAKYKEPILIMVKSTGDPVVATASKNP
jgi:hypothetical protein